MREREEREKEIGGIRGRSETTEGRFSIVPLRKSTLRYRLDFPNATSVVALCSRP